MPPSVMPWPAHAVAAAADGELESPSRASETTKATSSSSTDGRSRRAGGRCPAAKTDRASS